MDIRTDGNVVKVSFTDTARDITIEASGLSLHDAFESAIHVFKEMQEAAIEELQRWQLIRFADAKPQGVLS